MNRHEQPRLRMRVETWEWEVWALMTGRRWTEVGTGVRAGIRSETEVLTGAVVVLLGGLPKIKVIVNKMLILHVNTSHSWCFKLLT